MRDSYKVLVRKPQGKTSLWNPSHNWEDNIRKGLVQDRIKWLAW